MSAEGLQAAEEKMRAAGQPEEAVLAFARSYQRVEGGESAVVRSSELEAESLDPVSWPQAPSMEWNPPGHGDVYGALRRSGSLAALLEAGFRYAMISNIDNLGARVEPRIAAYLAAEGIPFLMETVIGTEAERKGGHLARRRSD